MITGAIKLVLSHVPLIMLVAAIAAASLSKRPAAAERYLAWLLLLAVGVDGLWAGVFHIFFPGIASERIGWSASPFEFEIGVADMALGVVAVASFWRSLEFKSAIALYAILFYAGVTIGHVKQAIVHANFSPDNFGLLLLITVVRMILLIGLLRAAWRADRAA